ncbi:hypothetical protein, partial [Paraburkholderia sediminicola]|uniref:hypothetical protein n=1 Tax=Paraburkholderia sediminicola TaxID=458836 RepID=UPI0038BA4483
VVDWPFLADQRPTPERDDRLERDAHAKSMSRPTTASKLFRKRSFVTQNRFFEKVRLRASR